MKIIQNNRFEKAYKKLHKNQLKDVNEAIRKIIDRPDIGQQKKGDLDGLCVYKFKMIDQLTLTAYSYENETITLTLIAIGSHENFYQDIKKNRVQE